jgi:hypothetical protein
MVKKIQLGEATGLHFEFQPLATTKQHGAGLAWGSLRLWVGDQLVWCQQNTDTETTKPVVWTWVDLLSGLARIWPWLALEESYPLAITPEHPGKLMDAAAQRWQGMAQGQAEAEEDTLFDFRQRHDLSTLLRGVFLPAMWVLREGHDCVLWSPTLAYAVRRPHAEVINTLNELGQLLADLLHDSTDPRATLATARWGQRQTALAQHLFTAASGLEAQEITELTGFVDLASPAIYKFFEIDPNHMTDAANSELLMAARMTAGFIPVQQQRTLLDKIRAIAPQATPALDALSQAAPALGQPGEPGFQQGYALANWLRAQLNMTPDALAEPAQLLADWGVALQPVDINAEIDAVAVWGQRHGPAVLPNLSNKSRASKRNGYRSTLAHEICHLLVDRHRALPAAEVLGGQSPKLAEQRANAFAAEFLLPRDQATIACQVQPDILQAAAALEQRFCVSRELVCHQIHNSSFGAHISSIETKRLDGWKTWA